MKFEISHGPGIRYKALMKRLNDPDGEKTLLMLMDLGERALNLMDRQGPEKVVLQAGTPGRNRKVVVIPLAEIFGKA